MSSREAVCIKIGIGSGWLNEAVASGRVDVAAVLALAMCFGCSTEQSASSARGNEAGTSIEWSTEPIVQIGAEGRPEYEFSQIVGLGRSEKGWWVFDRGSNQFREYDQDGNFKFSVGRTGSGPNEFRDVLVALPMSGDSVLIYDQRLQRVTLIARGGAEGKSWATPIEPGMGFLQLEAVLADGDLIWSELVIPGCEPGKLVWDTFAVYATRLKSLPHEEARFQPRHQLVRIGAWPNRLRWGRVSQGRCFPSVTAFSPRASISAWGDRIFISLGSSYELVILNMNDGQATRVRVPIPVARSPVTAAMITNYKNTTINAARLDENGRPIKNMLGMEQFVRDLDEMPYPDSLPLISDLFVDRQGVAWARKYRIDESEADTWWVFVPAASEASVVNLPKGLSTIRLYDVGRDYAAGITKDEFDVEAVTVYRIHRSETGTKPQTTSVR